MPFLNRRQTANTISPLSAMHNSTNTPNPTSDINLISHPKESNLQQILRRGLEQRDFEHHNKTFNAIFILKKTGSGKTSPIQTLSMNLSQLHAVYTQKSDTTRVQQRLNPLKSVGCLNIQRLPSRSGVESYSNHSNNNKNARMSDGQRSGWQHPGHHNWSYMTDSGPQNPGNAAQGSFQMNLRHNLAYNQGPGWQYHGVPTIGGIRDSLGNHHAMQGIPDPPYQMQTLPTLFVQPQSFTSIRQDRYINYRAVFIKTETHSLINNLLGSDAPTRHISSTAVTAQDSTFASIPLTLQTGSPVAEATTKSSAVNAPPPPPPVLSASSSTVTFNGPPTLPLPSPVAVEIPTSSTSPIEINQVAQTRKRKIGSMGSKNALEAEEKSNAGLQQRNLRSTKSTMYSLRKKRFSGTYWDGENIPSSNPKKKNPRKRTQTRYRALATKAKEAENAIRYRLRSTSKNKNAGS
ncbi:unnamed protein product [Orchesella dallaii]|uniref:Uncharacterized protein n=1 Tax=Orchesella dallaii TaxID=48710 RepID=A0ABP1R1H7_9HEXA